MTGVTWIDNAADVRDCTADWQGQVVGFDSEFIRVRTFHPIPALYQAALNGRVYLLDPVRVSAAELQPLTDVLGSPHGLIVMHACSEDLELLKHHLGVLPARLFDTQIAAGMTSADASLGYQSLVRAQLGLELDKSETRSDWRQRPLTEAQLRYAAADVVHLAALHTQLDDRLRELGRTDWFAEEMQTVLRNAARPRASTQYYLGLRDAWRLGATELTVLQALCAWREDTARLRDRPRAHIVPDALLYECARRRLRTRAEFEALLLPPLSSRWAIELESVVAGALVADVPAAPAPLPLATQYNELIKALRDAVAERARALAMPATVLASRRLLEGLVRALIDAAPLPLEWRGWRAEVVLASLLRITSEPRWRLEALPE